MTTQLRLVDPPEPRPRSAAGAASGAKRAQRATGRGRVSGVRGAAANRGRRAASWGDWRLDAGTRRVGRAGVARARQALEAAADQELRAS